MFGSIKCISGTWCIIIAALMIFGCDREFEKAFSTTPEQRVQASMNSYRDKLLSAPHGWRAILKTGSGNGYFYYFSFNDNGQVDMVADFNKTTASSVGEGNWSLKALQRITLSFSTYSYIHLPADPDGDVNGDPNGEGRLSDNEFAFSRISGDTIFLEGLQHGSNIYMLPATATEEQLLRSGRLKTIMDNSIETKGIQLHFSPETVSTVTFDSIGRSAMFQFLSKDKTKVEIKDVGYVMSINGIELLQPVVVGDFEVDRFFWDNEKLAYYFNVGDTPKAFVVSDQPYIFQTLNPFHHSIGVDFIALRLPMGLAESPLLGQSEIFTEAYQDAEANLNRQFNLTFNDIYLAFYPEKKSVIWNIYANRGTTLYLCRVQFDYTVTDDGIYDFAYKDADANGQAVYPYMTTLFTKFENQSFKGDFVGGNLGLAAMIKSVDEPSFSFVGYLVNE